MTVVASRWPLVWPLKRELTIAYSSTDNAKDTYASLTTFTTVELRMFELLGSATTLASLGAKHDISEPHIVANMAWQ